MRAPRSVASLAGATLVASVVMVAGGAVSTANASGPAYVNAGNLTLITGTGAAADRWVYDKGTTSTKDDTVQPVNAVKGSCRLNYAAGALVRTAGVGGLPGYANHTIGVTQGSTSRTCARINPAVVRGTVKREAAALRAEADREAARLDYLRHDALRSGTLLARELADHAPINYIRAFWS